MEEPRSPVRDRLLQQLSDGGFHSGQRLASALGLSRTAVWKHIQRLESEFGLVIDAVRGRGYRLAQAFEPLDAEQIRAELDTAALTGLDTIEVLQLTDSTNACAHRQPPERDARAHVWLAEHQTAGRGRRGRQWVSGFGQNLNLTLAWRFDLPMADLAGLSLAAGVVVAEVLRELGLRSHGLKWPNDLMIDGRKLCGILVEVSGEAEGPSVAVIGVGMNVHLHGEPSKRIDQPWVDLQQANPVPVSRNRLAGLLIGQLIEACRAFAGAGLEPFVERWRVFDHLVGSPVRIVRGRESLDGIYRGIAANGALLLEQGAVLSEHHAGEVSLRTVDGR